MLKVLTANALPPANAQRPPHLFPKAPRQVPFQDDITLSKLLGHVARVRLADTPQPRPAGRAVPEVPLSPGAQALEDEELAFQLFVQDTKDVSRNEDALDEFVRMEAMDQYNHEVAVALSEGREPPPIPDFPERHSRVLDEWESSPPYSTEGDTCPNSPQDEDGESEMRKVAPIRLWGQIPADETSDDEEVDMETLRAQRALRTRVIRLRKRLADVDFETDISSPPSPILPPTPPLPPPPPPCCTVCGDDIASTVVRLDCGHTFDVGCMREMFERATVDEELFPPKCCTGAVALSAAEPHLDPAFVARYHKKAREFSTANRVYCHVPTCAAFLGAAAPAETPNPETLRCEQCGAGTCAACKEQMHPGVPCHFAAEDAVLDLGKEHGWQRCGACKHLVELSIGCYHIVCRCGNQFCYLCAAPWKQCNCELFYVPPEEPEA
ncbi:uncharacterized protein TRAVEDRAFT_68573 [Trametes versicolor FP-101664 SS1]|uniref:uncharacterized protein n=1 Tax=Trametes versicolor (strain FP-101664) TaxID=717944 RepID=UPI000462216C|nr:uncharacterized protein TRAVEDRAFT_68573 [Trametes versicolor FP-101664 SS1]EIW64870.1 hypothetical protein TRAVEDRAFT_68573 [Trametes versicolor FP-101664 SS1]